MVIGGTDVDALGADVDIACGGNIAAGLAVGAAGVDADAAFQAADAAAGSLKARRQPENRYLSFSFATPLRYAGCLLTIPNLPDKRSRYVPHFSRSCRALRRPPKR